jgi:hypothetical protein
MKRLHVAIVLLASALVPALGRSGEHVTREVTIGPTPYVAGRLRAEGTLMGARNSYDSVQEIGCRADQEIGYCYAHDASGRYFMCSSSDPAMLTAMTAVNAASYIVVDAQQGNCKNLEITNSSSYIVPIGTVAAPPPSSGPVQGR